MNKEYEEMELNVLACLLVEPKLMQKMRVEDKYFVKYKRLWKYMKKFYEQYKTFDIQLMASMTTSKKELAFYLKELALNNALWFNFDLYQDALIKLAKQIGIERFMINQIYDYATDLFLNKIDLDEFEAKYQELKNKMKEKCQENEK